MIEKRFNRNNGTSDAALNTCASWGLSVAVSVLKNKKIKEYNNTGHRYPTAQMLGCISAFRYTPEGVEIQ